MKQDSTLTRNLAAAQESEAVVKLFCKARLSNADPPQDCNYPNCGCDPAQQCTGPFSDARDCPVHNPAITKADSAVR